MAAGDIENTRTGFWSDQAIGRLNPGQNGVNFVISGPISSSLVQDGVSSYDVTVDEGKLYLVGLGLRKDSGYTQTLLTCQAVRVPFKEVVNGVEETRICTLTVASRNSYPNWIYIWAGETSELNEIKRTWVPLSGSGENIYNEYQSSLPDLDYEAGFPGPGGIVFIPYIHPNYLTTDDYNGILGNVMDTRESDNLYTVLQKDVPVVTSGRTGRENVLRSKVNANLRYKNHLEDYHKLNAVGGLHAGELYLPGDNISRCEEQGSYFTAFRSRAIEFRSTGSVQTLDFPFMSYRAISASVYVDQYTNPATPTVPTPLQKVWEDMQGGNTDDAETIFFVKPINIGNLGVEADPHIADLSSSAADTITLNPASRTTIPDLDSILFRMDGHTAVRYTKATLYAPFLNTVYRTGEYGEVIELFTSSSGD